MLKEAIDRIVGLGLAQHVTKESDRFEVNGLKVYSRPGGGLTPVPSREVRPPELEIQTLSGVVDYLKSPAETDVAEIVVQSPREVVVYGDVEYEGVALVRTVWLRSVAHVKPVTNTKHHGIPVVENQAPSTVVEILLTHFKDGGDRQGLLRMLSNITDGTITVSEDDGVTQRARVKVGPEAKEAAVPNPLRLLSELHTFPEVGPVEADWVVRLSAGPKVSLLLADPTLSSRCVRKVRDWLAANLPDQHIIA